MLAFIDESGTSGYSRRLTPARDHELGLMCALLVPAVRVEEFRNAFQPGYERFLDAMPSGAKLHITDAFESGNECWASVARSVRSEFHQLIRSLEIFVIYEARRLALERASHEDQEDMISRTKAKFRSQIRVMDRPSQSKVEDQLVPGLVLKLNAFCENFKFRRMDLLFDQIDDKVARDYRTILDETRNMENKPCREELGPRNEIPSQK